MPKKNVVLMVALVLVVVGVALLINKKSQENGYSVVYMTTGEVYIGKLTTFPDLELRNGYILQIAKDATDAAKSNFQLNPVSDAFWAPEVMHLTRKNIVFYGPLLPTSKIAQTLAQKGK